MVKKTKDQLRLEVAERTATLANLLSEVEDLEHSKAEASSVLKNMRAMFDSGSAFEREINRENVVDVRGDLSAKNAFNKPKEAAYKPKPPKKYAPPAEDAVFKPPAWAKNEAVKKIERTSKTDGIKADLEAAKAGISSGGSANVQRESIAPAASIKGAFSMFENSSKETPEDRMRKQREEAKKAAAEAAAKAEAEAAEAAENAEKAAIAAAYGPNAEKVKKMQPIIDGLLEKRNIAPNEPANPKEVFDYLKNKKKALEAEIDLAQDKVKSLMV